MELKQYDKALDYYKQALGFDEKSESNYDIAVTLNNIGGVMNQLDRKQEAMEYFLKSSELKKQSLSNIASVAITSNNIAGVLIELNRKEEALAYLREAYSIRKQLNDSRLFTSAWNLAVVLKELGQEEESQRLFNEVIKMKKKDKTAIRRSDHAQHQHSYASLAVEREMEPLLAARNNNNTLEHGSNTNSNGKSPPSVTFLGENTKDIYTIKALSPRESSEFNYNKQL